MDSLNPAPKTEPAPWHALHRDDVYRQLDSGPEGLHPEEAARRLERHGPNRLTPPAPVSSLRRFLRQFASALILILVAAAVVMAMLGDWVDAAVVAGVVLINAAIGFIQEGKAEKAMEAIRNMLSPQASVVRQGARQPIPAEHLVPGDVVHLASGDKVPADLRVVEARGLQVQEAALTGESLPVGKHTDPVAEDAALGDRRSSLYSGTLVARGQAVGVVVATGDATEIGRIGALLARTEQGETPLMAQLGAFGRWLTAAILGLGAATFAVGVLFRGYTAEEMFGAAVGLAIAAIPEGLPAIMTITLAIGVTRMARRKAIIRRLPAVETLGAVSVICTDKTGTLTRNEMTVRSARTAVKSYAVEGTGYAPTGAVLDGGGTAIDDPLLTELARAVLLCNDARIFQGDDGWGVEGDPVDGAMLAFAGKLGMERRPVLAAYPQLDAVPFESDRAYMATLNGTPDGHSVAYVKGAPEALLRRCAAEMHADGPRPLDRQRWLDAVHGEAAEGRRLIAVACKLMHDAAGLDPAELDEGLVLLGLVGLIDPPREEAVLAVARCREAGIEVKMITGDHGATAKAIGEAVGLTGGVVTGPELDRMDDAALARAAEENAVFARATPEHKIKLVEALRRGGRIIAMTGDGVNDAPALKRADVGVAMGAKGTEAAKEASDMVLADDNFATIVHAVEEGRTVYDNLRKALIYILPTSFGQAGVIVLAVLLGTMMPITPTQILWVNMVTAVTLSISLAFDPAEADLMRRPPRLPGTPLLTPFLVWRVLFVSGLMVAGAAFIFARAMDDGRAVEEARTLVVNAIVLFEVAYLFNCRALYGSALRMGVLLGNRLALQAAAGIIVLQLAFTYAPPLQTLFDTVPARPLDWLWLAGLALLLFLVVEGEKRLLSGAARRARTGG
ncbi:cation-translocating P-type ATPase [Indioceanicola profundi]|uniref:cation-translocating P-type ATPase n=1 Tax=Indioceanicola profundi TaxID=2220096 RepID=UPI000E6AD00F|nr:HAD-IC family P-type ATPase [Indioceanicola profundi]